MAAPLNVQLRNAESSILFMQQEHAKTLQGLHQELHKLQKKCAEVTFELAMKSGSPDEEFYEKQHKILEAQLREKNQECLDLEAQLQKRDAKIGILEQQAKIQERRHQDDKKQHQQKVSSLCSELEQRSSNIAYLTTQLHHMKLRHQESGRPSSEESKRVGTPVPPPKDKPHHVRRNRLRSTSIGLLPGESLKAPLRTGGIDSVDLLDMNAQPYIVTTRCSSSASSHQRHPPRTDIMDLRPFLAGKSAGRGHSVHVRPTPPILPPIKPGEDRSIPNRRSVFAKRNVHRSNPEFESSSMETLAVEKVCSGENDLRQIEQAKTD